MLNTDFGKPSFDFINDESMKEYHVVVQELFGGWVQSEFCGSAPEVFGDIICKKNRAHQIRLSSVLFDIGKGD